MLDYAHAARKSTAELLATMRLTARGDAIWGTASAPRGAAHYRTGNAPTARHTGAANQLVQTVLGGPQPSPAQESWAARAAKALPILGLPYARGASAVAAALIGCCNPGGQHCAFIALLAGLTAMPGLVDALQALPAWEKLVRGSACASIRCWQLSGKYIRLASGFHS